MALIAISVALSGCVSTHSPEPVEITILHLNDLHARLTPDERGRGGFAQVATVLQREQAAADWSLTLHAGDLVQGSPVCTIFQGRPIYEMADHLGIDVNCLGNHEFDYGWQAIAEFVDRDSFETVCSNMVHEDGSLLVPAYVIREVGPLQVAVVGVMTEGLLDLTTTRSLGPYRVLPIVATLKPLLRELRERADLIVALVHGHDEETREILESLPDVHIAVQGHGHVAWKEPMVVDGRLGVTSDGYGRSLGRLKLSFDPDSRRIVDHSWAHVEIEAGREPADPKLAGLIDRWESEVSEIVDVTIGEASENLDRSQVLHLMEEALLETTAAEIAYLNYGGIRDSIPKGPVLARHVWNVMPFDNTVVTLSIEGEKLQKLVDPTSRDRPVVEEGSLEPRRMYRFTTSDYLLRTWRDRGIEMDATDEGVYLRDLFIAWISERGTIP